MIGIDRLKPLFANISRQFGSGRFLQLNFLQSTHHCDYILLWKGREMLWIVHNFMGIADVGCSAPVTTDLHEQTMTIDQSKSQVDFLVGEKYTWRGILQSPHFSTRHRLAVRQPCYVINAREPFQWVLSHVCKFTHHSFDILTDSIAESRSDSLSTFSSRFGYSFTVGYLHNHPIVSKEKWYPALSITSAVDPELVCVRNFRELRILLPVKTPTLSLSQADHHRITKYD